MIYYICEKLVAIQLTPLWFSVDKKTITARFQEVQVLVFEAVYIQVLETGVG